MAKIKDTIDSDREERIKVAERDEILKSKIRLATEQFCYIEFDYEGTAEDTIAEHNRLIRLYKPQGEGLDDKEMNRCVDEYLTTENLVNGTELYERMSPEQQEWFQITKRALKRIKSRE